MVDLANSVWRDFATDGIPASGIKRPEKSKIREWGGYIESLTMAAGYGNTVWFATKAALDADLAHNAGTPAVVYADSASGNNGIYVKSGASGAGSWAQIITYLPGYQFVTATDAGAGTANAIVATSSPRVAYTDGAQLVRLNIFETNTSGVVTVAFDGGAALTVQTASGNAPAIGGLIAGMSVLGVVDQSASVFRLLSDQSGAAIQAASEAAQAAAEAAAASIPVGGAAGIAVYESALVADIRGQLSTGPRVATRAALKALDAAKDTSAFLVDEQRSAVFSATNLSAEIAAAAGDESLYVAPNSDPTGAAGAWILAHDDGLHFKPRPITAPGIVKNVGDWLRRNRLLTDFAPVATPTNWSPTLQTAIDEVLASGGELRIPAGAYGLDSTVHVDVRGITGAPNSNQRRIRIVGDGHGSTVLLSKTDGMNTMSVTGDNPLTSASHSYTELANFSFGGATPTARTSQGLVLNDLAYLRLTNLSFHNFNVGLVNNGCLSSVFDNLVFSESVKGIVSSASASGPHSNLYNGCEFRMLTSLGYDQFDRMSGATFINCRVEGCGTHGDSATGGMIFRMTGSAGEAGPTFIGGYIEGNGGGFDFSFAETGAQRVNATFVGVLFNRVSSSKFVTNNIKTSGDVDVNLTGCTFTSYNSYVPDAARPYLNVSATTRLNGLDTCRWEDAVEAPAFDKAVPYAGYAQGSLGAGVVGTLPAGWTVAQASAGLFTVTHNIGHTNYIVNATCIEGNVRSVERIVRNTNSFQVKTINGSGVATDADFGFQLQKLKPY